MKTVKYLPFLFLFLVFSCTEKINVPLGTNTPKLVIECTLDDYYNRANAIFSISESFNNNANYSFIAVDTAFITDSRGNYYPLFNEPIGVNPRYQSDYLTPQVGATYYLTVIYQGKTYTAQCTMQPKVDLDTAYAWQFLGNGDNQIVSGRISDPANETNYYRYYTNANSSYQYVLADNLINGTKFSLNASRQFVKSGDTGTFYLLCIDKANYDYWNVLIQNSTLTSNQSAAPANPVSNISGDCYGYFSVHHVSRKAFVVH